MLALCRLGRRCRRLAPGAMPLLLLLAGRRLHGSLLLRRRRRRQPGSGGGPAATTVLRADHTRWARALALLG